MTDYSIVASDQAASSRPRGRFRRLDHFRREEDGSLLIFGLFCFVIMLLLSGIALDVMRAEERRTLQMNTIDRAALAAADLQQTLPAKDVVKDYFVKAGLKPPTDDQITVVQGAFGDSRRVSIAVKESVPTWFMSMVGIKSLSVPAASTAEESVGEIEISLVLDISGSMGGSRINNLRPAAKSFVDQIFDSTEAGNVSISIIPYSTQVALSPNLISYFNVTNEQSLSNCIEFDPAEGDFTSTAMSFGTGPFDRVYQRNGHFDPFYKASPPQLFNCSPNPKNQILPFSDDRAKLKAFIDNLQADGNTSIDLGMKWGTALLDPSMRPVVTNMIANGKLNANVAGRPFNYDNGKSLKVIVLMTDGENTTEYKLRNTANGGPYNKGASRLYRNLYYTQNASLTDDYSVNQYSLYDAGKKQWYSVETGLWLDHAWGDGSRSVTTCGKKSCSTTTVNDTGYTGTPRAQQMTWPEVWATMGIYYLSDNIIYPAYNSSSTRNLWRPSSVSSPQVNTYVANTKDSQTLSLCDAAKAKGKDVRIYTIAFEAPTRGQQLLSDCASAGYYQVEGTDIQDAFSGIVQSINKLRLTH
ncbi:MAG TPA: vWA domain-containing protein [Albidovulum sp.]|uniref:pilus assembly protein TadG-related protein n=1 Tax=Albidovulum sp. TaxID=1872424 RepID=UPI002C566B8E|nr:vWA domain-containing protein [Albidovulum sp.]